MDLPRRIRSAVVFSGSSNDAGGNSSGSIFVRGLVKETTVEQLGEHFRRYGKITNKKIIYDMQTGLSRGFGFVTFADSAVVDQVIQKTHVINGKKVDIKLETYNPPEPLTQPGRIYVGGLLTNTTEDQLANYFSSYGKITKKTIMHDMQTGLSRGFGFVTFADPAVVDEVIQKTHVINGNKVKICKAKRKGDNLPSPESKHYNYSQSSYATYGRAASSSHDTFGSEFGRYGQYGGSSASGAYGRNYAANIITPASNHHNKSQSLSYAAYCRGAISSHDTSGSEFGRYGQYDGSSASGAYGRYGRAGGRSFSGARRGYGGTEASRYHPYIRK